MISSTPRITLPSNVPHRDAAHRNATIYLTIYHLSPRYAAARYAAPRKETQRTDLFFPFIAAHCNAPLRLASHRFATVSLGTLPPSQHSATHCTSTPRAATQRNATHRNVFVWHFAIFGSRRRVSHRDASLRNSTSN